MTELTLLSILRDFGIAFIVGFCWAILFGTSKKVLVVAGLLGGMGHALRFVLIQLDFGLISSTLAASVLIGFIGIFAARFVDHPPRLSQASLLLPPTMAEALRRPPSLSS